MHFARYIAAVAISLVVAAPALGQEPLPTETARVEAAGSETASPDGTDQQVPRPGIPLPPQMVEANQPEGSFFKLVAGDFKNFFSLDTARVMGYASVTAVAAAPWDREGVNNGFNIPTALFESGNVIGTFVFQGALGAASFGIGKATGNGKLAVVGRDIVRVQILSQTLVQAVKVTVQRERPDGSNNMSFPSGHAASTFATASVLQRHYGWKVGVPAYALGSYVALARMAWNRHHATDVVMGAGFGIASGRTVTMSVGKNRFSVGVQPQVGGASMNFTKIYK